jgi:hypothetical protein
LQLRAVEFSHNPFFGPDTVSVRTSPLGPIRSGTIKAK